MTAHVPLIGVDAWEHAFYLQYKNVKADYFKNIWCVSAKLADHFFSRITADFAHCGHTQGRDQLQGG